MDDPLRPEPPAPWFERFRDRWLRTRIASGAGGFDPVAPADRPVLAVVAAALGSSALTIAAILGWQAWNAPSATSIDERLPPIVRADPEATVAIAPEATTVVTGATGAGPAAAGSDIGIGAAPSVARAASPVPDSTQRESGVPVVGVVVHVSGSVAAPGVVELVEPSRVHDAVEAAGGPTTEADLDRVNLAAPVADGERIHIPAVGEDPPTVVAGARVDRSAPSPDPTPVALDLNSASPLELEALPGVGPATAGAIVALRTARGPYLSVDELIDVDGIGPTRLEALRPHVYVTGR